MPTELTAFWKDGIDSANDPAFLGQNNLAFGFNGLHRGGRYRTRPGFSEVIAPPITGVQTDGLSPQGFKLFRPLNGPWYQVMAHAGKIYVSPFPFTAWTQLTNLQFYPFADLVIFECAVKSTITNADGSLTFVAQPYPVLLIQDGFTRCGYWDGVTALHSADIPIGQTMKWNAQRLWVADGHKLHAGNEGDPLAFTEEKIVATGGFFVLPDVITRIGETPDQQALLVHTAETTDTFQSSILDRTAWPQTPGFQSRLFNNIGAVGPLAGVNQYGVSWWMSHNGIIGLDTALQTYRTRRIRYADTGLARSKAKLHKNLYRVCAGEFENFLFFSWPSADRFNAHTVVMDQTSFEVSAGEQQAAAQSSWAGPWKGIRPVQWATAVIEGRRRCYCLSRDYAVGSDYQIGIWEAFCTQRYDITLDGTVRRILVGMETRQLAFGAELKKITAIEALFSEIRNQVDLQIFFNGRRTAFRKAGEKTIQATQRNPDLSVIDQYAPQQRTVRSNTILTADQSVQSAQSPYNQGIDLGFGVYLQWLGDMAADAVRIFFDAQPKLQVGASEASETDTHLVDWLNNEQILAGVAPPALSVEPHNNAFINTITQRYLEPFYNSRS